MASTPSPSTLLMGLNCIQDELASPLPPPDEALLCCCHIFNPSLQPLQHLDDCELHLLGLYGDHGSSRSSEDDLQASAKRRKHRESMARLRCGWRTSIATLQLQRSQLEDEVRRAVAASAPCLSDASAAAPANPRMELQRGYRALVEEQLRLQVERTKLEASQARSEKYARLLERELARVQLFRMPRE